MGGAPHRRKADLFRTLANPRRVRVLEILATHEHSARELLPAGPEASDLHHQLAVLRRAGLVSVRREGLEVIYALAGPQVAALLTASELILAGTPVDGPEFPTQTPSRSPESTSAKPLPGARSAEPD